MPDKENRVLYDGPPIPARMAAYLLLGIGGLVLVPIGLTNRAWWLLVPAVPLLLAGLVLSQVHLRIVIEHDAEHDTGVVHVTRSLLGLKLHERRYPPSDAVGLNLRRVAGDERERPSDTWYLRLQLGAKTYIIGRYDSREHALLARYAVGQALEVRAHEQAATEAKPTFRTQVNADPR